MKGWRIVLGLLPAALALPASAHRLDEYLQLTALSIGHGRIRATLYLTPGVAVAKRVIGLIDANGDGLLSVPEQRAYAARVANDLALSADGAPRTLRLVAFRFPTVGTMRKGEGEIRIDLDADAPSGLGRHALTFENRHQRPIGAYLVECLAPEQKGLEVVGQSRSPEQARYGLEYLTSDPRPSSAATARPSPRTARLGPVR